MNAGSRARGELAIVLHTHMPYVEGFGTWPFGEEWLWEAIATSYLPLLEVLERGAPLTVSLTPVLADQLEASGIGGRLARFLGELRPETHRLDIEQLRGAGAEPLAAELARSALDYERAHERLSSYHDGLLAALAPYVGWTSAATHAVLPLLATDAGVTMQVQSGIDAHRARFGAWRGGFWLPECAHAPWLDPLLVAAGVRATCLDLTDRFGLGAPEHLRPLVGPAGPLVVPLDRATIELVWSADGYPAHPRYRDYHALTPHHHRAWANDGSPYDHAAALEQARAHAADFVARVSARLASAAAADGGLVVCALDTELLGHWWYEGVAWLAAVVEESVGQGLALVRLDDALAHREPAPAPAWADDEQVTTWGAGRDLSTWSGPSVADLAWSARDAELRVLGAAQRIGDDAVRELLALQASDWAFLVSRQLAPSYGRERARGHRDALDGALAGTAVAPEQLRNLAVHATRAPLLAS